MRLTSYFLICVVGMLLHQTVSDRGWEILEGNEAKRVTKRENKLLNRQKRYLTFPKGASFIMTISLIRSLMIKTPTGLRLACECDVPFTLPSDTRWFRRRKGVHMRQKRDVFSQFALGLQGMGFNGTACVNRAICDARAYAPLKGLSLLKDLLMALFKFDEPDEYLTHCTEETYLNCELPLLDFIEGLMQSNT